MDSLFLQSNFLVKLYLFGKDMAMGSIRPQESHPAATNGKPSEVSRRVHKHRDRTLKPSEIQMKARAPHMVYAVGNQVSHRQQAVFQSGARNHRLAKAMVWIARHDFSNHQEPMSNCHGIVTESRLAARHLSLMGSKKIVNKRSKKAQRRSQRV